MSMTEGEQDKSQVAKREEKILNYWEENNIFQKTLEKKSPKGEYVFYDGPPFATGMPHYGHILPGTIKDVIPRYKTMKGFRVPRRWGWDTHGLPIENLIEKELGLNTKKDIEEFGIDRFNQAAKDSVFRYDAEWKKIIPRTGRWIDMENPYITMSPSYTESVWWMFKELHNKKLLNEGFKSMHLCPRCETTLSNFEVNQGYEDIVDISVTAQFELIDELGTFVLAWTTTPWTLPGNVALAISPKETYVKVKSEGKKFIVAKNLTESVFEGKEFEIVEEVKSENLIGKKYKPLFGYYAKDADLENHNNGWKIYADDFVTTEEGTGIVHIAPAFGDEDYQLSKREDLPFVQHVKTDGTFKDEVADFKGMFVKPKGDHQATDIEIIKFLAHNDKLFSKKKITHSYPHCWRCDTPLLNYASSSWFIDVPKIRNKLVSLNEKINWVPENIGKNRFGNWLKEAREWAISRSRFWGAPIPVWRSEDKTEMEVLGSVSDIKKVTKGTNKYFIIRHGEAEHNVSKTISDNDSALSRLTEKGKKEIEEISKKIKSEGIDLIFTSPLHRTKETAKIISEICGIKDDQIIVDERIKETQIVEFNGKSLELYRNFYKTQEEKFYRTTEGGENLTDMKNRVGDFIYEIDKKYQDKKILIVTHEYVAWMLNAVAGGLNPKGAVKIKERYEDFIKTGELTDFDFAPLPHNKNYELDFHRPYIDEVSFQKNGKEMKRVADVFDVWIDSGSVPFASNHYPFEKDFDPKGGWFKKTKGYPADFIAEGLDQTRGWFYTMLVLNAALFDRAPYKNVIVNGQILAEDGKKMSKRLKNYPPVDYALNKYGADALRYFLMASPAVRSEDFNFSEKGVDEVVKKLILRLDNVVSFYEMYKDESLKADSLSDDVLDKWVLARLAELNKEVEDNLNKFLIDKSARPIIDFVDDLSTWYIRRSRDRFKDEDREKALKTTKFVLLELSKIIAPFTPFIAEDIYLRVGGELESVHLENWTENLKTNVVAIKEMKDLRNLVTFALDARTAVGIKVRQPLSKLFVKSDPFGDDLVEILKDEVNVKEVIFDKSLEDKVKLDTEITNELKLEGDSRELIRAIQSKRKDLKLIPEDKIILKISNQAEQIFEKFGDDFKKIAGVEEVKFGNFDGELIKLQLGDVVFSVEKI